MEMGKVKITQDVIDEARAHSIRHEYYRDEEDWSPPDVDHMIDILTAHKFGVVIEQRWEGRGHDSWDSMRGHIPTNWKDYYYRIKPIEDIETWDARHADAVRKNDAARSRNGKD